jgi:hypothetical protein
MSLIGYAMAGGLAGAGAAGERAFARLGERQSRQEEQLARQEFEKIQAQIATDRAAALERMRSVNRRDEQQHEVDIKTKAARAEREEVSGLIRGAETGVRDAGPYTPSMVRGRVRDDLLAAGRVKEAADYDRVTTPDKPTVVTTPYGSRTTVLDPDGRVTREVDNSIERAESDRTRAGRTGSSRDPKPLTQDQANKIHEQARKFADGLAAEMPHPLADPALGDKDAMKDTALTVEARRLYTRAMQAATRTGAVVDPSEIEDAIRGVAGVASARAIAAGEQTAAKLFDDSGRLRTGADAAIKELGIRATDRDSFLRAYRDKYLGVEMDRVMAEEAERRRGGARDPGAGQSAAPPTGGAPTAAEPPVTEGGRPDDPEPLARRPAQPGLVGGAAAANGPESDEDIVLREQDEMVKGARRSFSPEGQAAQRRLDEQRRSAEQAYADRQRQADLERSRAAARNARGN